MLLDCTIHWFSHLPLLYHCVADSYCYIQLFPMSLILPPEKFLDGNEDKFRPDPPTGWTDAEHLCMVISSFTCDQPVETPWDDVIEEENRASVVNVPAPPQPIRRRRNQASSSSSSAAPEPSAVAKSENVKLPEPVSSLALVIFFMLTLLYSHADLSSLFYGDQWRQYGGSQC